MERTLFERPVTTLLSGATVTHVSAPSVQFDSPCVMTYMLKVTRPRSTPLNHDETEAEDLQRFLEAYDPRPTRSSLPQSTSCTLNAPSKRTLGLCLMTLGGASILWGAKMLYEIYSGKCSETSGVCKTS